MLRSVPSPREDYRGRWLDRTGVFEPLGTVPVVSTHLSRCGIDRQAREIRVESTAAFPDSGVLEIAGNHNVCSCETVEYEGKTEKSFLNCKRGVDGTEATSHWGETRVWSGPEDKR